MLRYRPLPRADRGLVDQISMHRLCLRSAAICELGGVLYLNFAQRSAARGELKRYLEEQTSSTRPVAALLIALLGLSGRFGPRVGTFATGRHPSTCGVTRPTCVSPSSTFHIITPAAWSPTTTPKAPPISCPRKKTRCPPCCSMHFCPRPSQHRGGMDFDLGTSENSL